MSREFEGVRVPGKSVQLSVRVSDEDALFLADLEVDGAVTPSDKLRAILRDARRRHQGHSDPAEGSLMLRDMAARSHRSVRRHEAKTGEKSQLISNLYERVPDIMAQLISGVGEGGGVEDFKNFENALREQVGLILKDFLTLGLVTPLRVIDEENYWAELKSVSELIELTQQIQQRKRGELHE